MANEKLSKILGKNGLKIGRMISLNKIDYVQTFPSNKVFFNACIFELNKGNEVWFGDIDIDDEETMKALINSALEYDEPFLLTSETPYRFSKTLKIGSFIDARGLKSIKNKLGWVGGIDGTNDKLELAVVTEEGIDKSSDNFDKVLFSPKSYLTMKNKSGKIDYIKSGMKILSNFV